jgi:transcriptional regulator with XRE-family HTH domain
MDIKELGSKLKTARENKKLTQAEVAKKSGLNTNFYAVVERGETNISFEKLNKVLEVLGIKLTLPK